ncbi:MAG: AAA family ATPase [Burkholderiaceae bacterium]|nr:AAA family ATPase [Burkholderiaceae bacterium]
MVLSDYALSTVHQDDGFVLCRGQAAAGRTPHPPSVLVLMPASDRPAPDRIRLLEHEFGFRSDLEPTWAIRPLALGQLQGRTTLILEDPLGEPLSRHLERQPLRRALTDQPPAEPAMELGTFLGFAVSLAAALGEVHRRGIIHKNVKPLNIFVNATTHHVWLTGFGIASRLQRERQSPGPPEMIAGTLAYIAPEQTGRMNRSVDARSDLYAVGVTLYEMLIGSLPFAASDPMEWVHCHIARQPISPRERIPSVPATVSAIVMKLLAKTAEDRYQTAAGLERDLRRCLSQFEGKGFVDEFPLGDGDVPDRLLIPERLYGRDRDVEALLDASERIAKEGTPELILLSGYAGIGKSSLVGELNKVLAPPSGMVFAGKFDQYKRDIPYATWAQVLRGLVRALLASSDRELTQWHEVIRSALGPNAQLIVSLVPELKLIIGESQAVPELPPLDAQRRFSNVFKRFLGVFTRPGRPLVLFLDDLQWLDIASLALLEDLLRDPDVRHILVIGAYRDNEVTATDALARTLDSVRNAGGIVRSIRLAPLSQDHMAQLIADALRSDRARTSLLAALIHQKTEGNPFFAIQFLTELVEEDLLRFDPSVSEWRWDLSCIHAKDFADNVIELMVEKLARLAKRTKAHMQQLACLGSSAAEEFLAMCCEVPQEQLYDELAQALHADLIQYSDGRYRFVHDRVREATYSLVPAGRRAAAHLRIGKILAGQTGFDKQSNALFEVANQLNLGVALITGRKDRLQVARIDLAAGKHAKESSAYSAALAYLRTGSSLLPEGSDAEVAELKFEFELHSADCEVCLGALDQAGNRLTALANRVEGVAQRCAVARRRVELHAMLGASDRAIDIGLDCLRHVGIDWPLNPTSEVVRAEYDRIWSALGGSAIEDLVDLPLMEDQESLAVLDVLAVLTLPAMLNNENLHALNVSTAVSLSLQRGNSHAAPHAYAAMALISGARFGQHAVAYRLAKAACQLVEDRGLNHFGGKVYWNFAVLVPWTRPLEFAIDPVHRAFQLSKEQGNPASAAHTSRILIFFLLALGHPLDQVELEAEKALESTSPFGSFLERVSAPLALIRSLRGKTSRFGSLDDGSFAESAFEQRLTGDPRLALLECYYWIRKLQARFLANDYVAAAEAASKAETWYATSAVLRLFLVEMADFCFFAALARAACCLPLGPDPYSKHRDAIHQHHVALHTWAETCPENFSDRAALVGAEIARVEGRPLDAMDLYEQAIQLARTSKLVHNEAIACETAARFYAMRGNETNARAHLNSARFAYLRWGADGKVRQLDALHPQLFADTSDAVRAATISAPIDQLDLATVIKVSQAVSREMVLDTLVDTIMRTAMEHAGAQRALLLLVRGDHQWVSAEASCVAADVLVRSCDEAVNASVLPETILRFALHTQDAVVVGDALKDSLFSLDPYVQQHRVRSALCLPLSNQGRKLGLLYFENNLASHVFAPTRTALLKFIASQAAISLENSRLYRDVAEREARIRRLVDANIIGVFIWELDGRIVETNDAFLQMVGYAREEYVEQGLRWTELTPPEWLERDEEMIPHLKISGTLQPFEKEYLRKDGSRVPVLVGVASFSENSSQGVAYVVDLTERKQAQEALDRAALELAHVSRVSALTALTASIAHEVNQPLSGILTNANTCLRMLDSWPPNIDGARETVRRTIRDGARAADVIARLREMFSKRSLTLEPLELNEVAREVIALLLAELQRNQTTVETQLAEDLPMVSGDRVQLQQVILNLVRNAADAMAEVYDRQRQMVLSTRCDDMGQVCLSVCDSGVGLPREDVGSVFDAFHTTKTGGMGIGLFVSRSIIERHRGRIWAEHNSGMPGATFTFSIPRLDRTISPG